MSALSISVIMPAYNHEKFVSDAIDSVLNQSFEDLELIIIDDGSTDKTAEVIKSFEDSRIKYHYQSNQDAFNSINNGMALARGEFITIINSDDVYEKTRLGTMMQVHADTGAQCIFSDVMLIDDIGNVISDEDFWWIRWHENNRQYYYQYKDLYAAFLHANIMVTTSNLFMTRQAYEKVGNFEALRYLHDYDYIFRLLNTFPDSVHYLADDKLMYYRLHGGNTLSEAAVIGREQDLMIIRKNILNKCPEEIHPYINIGLDRIIELEHELVQAREELAQAQKDSNAAKTTQDNNNVRSRAKHMLGKLFR